MANYGYGYYLFSNKRAGMASDEPKERNMEKSVLDDVNEYPSEEVLKRHLGRGIASWRAFQEHLKTHDPALNDEWKFYKDGKSWLYKVTCKRLTLCWVTVFKSRFMASCYFPDRAEDAVLNNLNKDCIDQFQNGPRVGKTRAVSVKIRKLADLKAAKEMMKTRLLVG